MIGWNKIIKITSPKDFYHSKLKKINLGFLIGYLITFLLLSIFIFHNLFIFIYVIATSVFLMYLLWLFLPRATDK